MQLPVWNARPHLASLDIINVIISKPSALTKNRRLILDAKKKKKEKDPITQALCLWLPPELVQGNKSGGLD